MFMESKLCCLVHIIYCTPPLDMSLDNNSNNDLEKDGSAVAENTPFIFVPSEEISQSRDLVAKSLQNDIEQTNYDIEQNVREIRAILTTNAEIFDRIMAHRTEDVHVFYRYAYEVVETHTISKDNKNTTQFVTYPERTVKKFDMKPLRKIPAGLDDIFFFKMRSQPFSVFVDYESFFNRSLILHEDVLGPFLAKLKDHLMSIQVYLGSIEVWIMVPKDNISYLESTFGKSIAETSPDYIDELEKDCGCPLGTHPDHLLCLRCKRPYSSHDDRGEYERRCHDWGHYGNYTKVFRCKKFQVLKKYVNNSTLGRIDSKFEIAKESDQKKLEMLLKFMAME